MMTSSENSGLSIAGANIRQEIPALGNDGSIVGLRSRFGSVHRIRRFNVYSERQIEGGLHIIVSLSAGYEITKRSGGRTDAKIAELGRVTVLGPEDTSRFIHRGSSDILHISLHGSFDGGRLRSSFRPAFQEANSKLELLAYRVAGTLSEGREVDDLYLSSLEVNIREALVTRPPRHFKGGLSPRAARLLVALIDYRVGCGTAGSLTVNDLAREIGLTVFHFSRAFKQTFGISPYQYVLRRRLQKARALIIDGGMDLDAIAGETQFSSVPHLVAAFAREFGLPPGRFRALLGFEGRYAHPSVYRHP